MGKNRVHQTGNKNSVVNFGVGWITIIYGLLMFWFYVGMCNDGSNITVPALAEKLGTERANLLNINTAAGLAGVVFFIIMGQVNNKIGARLTAGICTVVSGVAYIILGQSTSLPMYMIAMCFVAGGIMSAGYIGGGALVAQWFPKKKGIVMGYTTMGHNLASAFFVPLITVLVARSGISGGMLPIGIAAILLGVFGLIFIRNTPQERGINPDNVSDEVYNAEYDTSTASDTDGGWTTKRLLHTKELWQAGITTGMFQICSAGVMTQLVLRNMELGFTQTTATMIMTILALVGTCGSWLIGVLDDKFGTKRTMIGYGLWFMAALLCNFTNFMPAVYISLFMIAIGIGGAANFSTSLPTSIFGRHGFNKVNSIIFPIQGAVQSLSFLVNGVAQKLFHGEIRYAYPILAGIALLTVILTLFIDEHKYNRDYAAAHKK